MEKETTSADVQPLALHKVLHDEVEFEGQVYGRGREILMTEGEGDELVKQGKIELTKYLDVEDIADVEFLRAIAERTEEGEEADVNTKAVASESAAAVLEGLDFDALAEAAKADREDGPNQ